jgi:hypothetical protein
MTARAATARALNRTLRGVHRGVLVALAVCAGAIAVSAEPETTGISAGAERGFTYAAVGLAVASILTRPRRPTASIANPRAHVALSLVSLLCAGGLGIVGVAFALAGGPRTTALVYALAGAIFSLRPPKPIADRPPADPS